MTSRRAVASAIAVSVLVAGCVGAPNDADADTPGASDSARRSIASSVARGARGSVRPARAHRRRCGGSARDRLRDGTVDANALELVAATGDARLGWILSDLLRFTAPGTLNAAAITEAFVTVTGFEPSADERFGSDGWVAATNLLIGWELPAHPGYREDKAAVFLPIEPAWGPFFEDANAPIDWRWISWGGVFIDDREFGSGGLCARSCIPALDDPGLTAADEGTWYSRPPGLRGRRQRRGGRIPEAHHGSA